ncbi:MAG: ATP-binding protein [bacterium]
MPDGNDMKPVDENRRILIIDDDPYIASTYKRILCAEASPLSSLKNSCAIKEDVQHCNFYDLTVVHNGEDGIEAVKESLRENKPYVAAFVDLMLPGLNGAETTAWIWMIDPNIKILIVTAYSQYLSEDCAMVAGRDDLFYLRKPFNPEEIRQFARAFTKQWSLEQEKTRLTQDLKVAQEKLEDMNNNLQKKVEEQTTMLIQSDKMASIGLLAAGIAHEINNPVAFMNSNLASMKSYSVVIKDVLEKYQELEQYTEKGAKKKAMQCIATIRKLWEENKMDFIFGDLVELIDDSLEGAERISTIVRDLKSFARVKSEDIEDVDLNEVIDTTLNIIWNEIKYKTEILKEYGELPPITCVVQKISQVFMNLLTNAAQAIEKKGTIRISTRHLKERSGQECIEARVSDDGAGIPKKYLTKIFDPFFTTKQDEGGTGLGLKITYDIIKAHGGTIRVESEEGKGTTFIIRLPLNTEP